MDSKSPITSKSIFLFWAPLGFTWLMMALEAPYIAAFVARLESPKENLAAFGAAIAFAILIEAPVIMIMSASTAIVKDRESYFKLRNFTFFLNFVITLVMVVLLFTPAMDHIMGRWIGLSPKLVDLVHGALVILLPWPCAIGYRRFFNGVVIAQGQPRRVTYCAMVRLVVMSLTCLILFDVPGIPGAWVGAAALSAGVTLEAITSRLWARKALAVVCATPGKGLSYPEIAHFYYPLALTATIALAVHPMVTFLVGKSRFPLESLAVIPVVNGFCFLFRSMGLSFQEVVIALVGEEREHFRHLRKFAFFLGLGASCAMALIAYTPLAEVWFVTLSGLSPQLVEFARPPAMILVAIPALSVLISFQRALLVGARKTQAVTWASAIEVGVTLLVLYLGIHSFHMVGAVAAAMALLLGRLASNAFLMRPCRRIL